MELVKAGTLDKLIKLQVLDERECRYIMKQILEGLKYIHELGLVHRDLKPQNILMDSFELLEGAVKIADFGLGTQGDYSLRENCGTIIYMAPEQLSKLSYHKVTLLIIYKPVDIWAAGIIMYTLLTGRHPFYKERDNIDEYTDKVLNGRFEFPGEVSE